MKKTNKILDWLLILIGLASLTMFFVLKGPYLSKLNFIALAFIPVLNLIKNKTYKIICAIIAISMLVFSYCSITGLI
jgi:hypothetical protein